MTKQELRDGDRLTLRNGNIMIKDGNYIMNVKVGDIEYQSINNFNDELYHNHNNCDIVKVERIQFDVNHLIRNINDNHLLMMIKSINQNLTYQTIWEREEIKADLVEKASDGNE